ncbi:hypothetical protein Aperf_G00000111755 [Anoplocephala perfoliata]
MGSDDSNVEIDPEALKAEIHELTQQIKIDPFAYDAHVRRIYLLRTAKSYSILREAREFMSEYFPLTPELWLHWIEDERALLTEEDSRDPIENLFKRAINDYQSVDVWLEYCHFAIGELAASGNLDRTRSVLEAALAAQGLNFGHGAVLFEIYREFEKICLVQLQSNNADETAIKDQMSKIDSIYRRHLGVPHSSIDLDQTMEEYQEFLKDAEVSSACKMAFEAAKNKWNALESFELAVSDIEEAEEKDESALLTTWQNYLTWALDHSTRKATKANVKSGNTDVTITPLEMICLFERAITDLCLHPNIWQQAADYLEIYVPADQQKLIDTLSRAVRNVTWSSDIWCRNARAVESRAWSEHINLSARQGADREEAGVYHISKEFDPVRQVFEHALSNAFSSANELMAVWMNYCDFLLRLIQHSNDPLIKEKSTKMLRDNFQRAQTHISLAFPKQEEHDFPLLRYWAFTEAKFLGDMERTRELWTSILKDGHNGNNPTFWISYLDFAKNFDNIDNLVRVAGMAVNSVTGDYAETVFQTARRCLAENGLDLKRLKEFDVKVTQRRLRLKTSNQNTDVMENDQHYQQQQKSHENRSRGKPSKPSGKRKAEEASITGPSAKRAKPAAFDEAPKWDGDTADHSRPKHGETVIHDPTKDDKTVFISNLPFSTTEEELKTIFEKCGEVASIRLARDYAGKSKGFGYVEFTSPDIAAAALKLDRTPINTTTAKGTVGRPMFVSVCDTTRSKTAGFAYSTGAPEPNKLFVKNLDKTITEESLKTFFTQHGHVTSVRLATFRNGAPKGHAYVEFSTEEEASRALIASDGALLGSKAISVAISNPPSRPSGGQPPSRPQPQSKSKSAPNPNARARAHTQLAFMPRALHRPAGGSTTSNQPSTTSSTENSAEVTTGVSKSNDDFRKMFLNQ